MAQSVPRERVIVMAVGFVLAAPLALWLGWPRGRGLGDVPSGFTSVCPSAPGQPIVVLEFSSRSYQVREIGDNFETVSDVRYRFASYSPDDGRSLEQRALPNPSRGGGADCLAVIDGKAWMWTTHDGFHVRDVNTGEIARSQAQLLPGVALPLNSAVFDDERGQLIVGTQHGRFYAVDSTFALAAGHAAPPGNIPRVPAAGFAVRRRLVDRLRGESSSRGKLTQRGDQTGNPRAMIFVGDEQLAGTDWLRPSYVVYPPTGAAEWPDPPSLIVCEPVEVGGDPVQLTRVGLDGTILWTYRPGARHGWFGRPPHCTWQASGDGQRLLFFTKPNGMVGIDATTGREVFRRVL